MMGSELVPPTIVTNRDGSVSRLDNVREEDRGDNARRSLWLNVRRQQLENRFALARLQELVAAKVLEAGAWRKPASNSIGGGLCHHDSSAVPCR